MLTSVSVHLLILILCFVLAYCDKWPSLHHKRVEKLSPDDRTKIREVVEENWDELLKCSKNLIDARLEDGEKFIVYCSKLNSQNAIGWLDFSKRTEKCEEQIFGVVKAMKSKLPLSGDGNDNLNIGVNNTTHPSTIIRIRIFFAFLDL